MTSKDLREKYLKFYKDKGHTIISSSSLLPENDPSLLFTNSGMFPLVPYLLGEKHPGGNRLTNSQKCFRSEDIDEVGDSRHNTFFEMLGNWSLGDYFKDEQLRWWYQFLVEELKIDPSKLYQTVYLGSEDGKIKKDQESISIIRGIFSSYNLSCEEGPETATEGDLGPGVPCDFEKQRIFAYRDKNWWQRGDAVGELGGPDSETFYDTGKEHDKAFGPHCHPNCDCGRFLEIGNSVFMQYQKTKEGWKEMESKNVDFGGGFERILTVINNKESIFETDLFNNLIYKIEELSAKKYQDNVKAFEVIADHLKSSTFIIADDAGLSPSNSDQGYVVRRLIRRAVRYGRQLGIDKQLWTKDLAEIIIREYQEFYPELSRNEEFVKSTLDEEERKFSRSLENGLKEFNKIEGKIDGKVAFKLYQSYGFPIEITEELAKERGFEIDSADFYLELKKHQELSRTASAGKFKGGLADSSEETVKLHSAAHLLLASLRKVLGDHVEQRGSNITAERLRFDFSHPEKVNKEQLAEVESLVNQAISRDYKIICEEMSLDEAKKRGAIGVFDSKYEEKVKVYSACLLNSQGEKDLDNIFSQEICGGPHVANTKILGNFSIVKEQASSSGVRRIKAVLKKD